MSELISPSPFDTGDSQRGLPLHFILIALLVLFCLRVAGQLIVMLFQVPWLPPAEEWFSGALAYPPLLTCQILIIALYTKICSDISQSRGFFASARDWLGKPLIRVAAVYLGVMIIRYGVRMALYPHERWVGGCIPIFFHCVLASFLIVFGIYQLRTLKQRNDSDNSSKVKSSHRSSHFLKRQRFYRIIISNILVSSFWVAVALGVAAWVGYLLAPSLYAGNVGYRRAEYAVRIERAQMLTSDGAKLVAEVYRPVHTAHSPTVLVRIPFTKSLKNQLFANLFGRAWAERGYTVVIQGTRGRYDSSGKFYPLTFERKDGTETLQWLEKQSWFNGQIVTWGGSTFGHTQWAICDRKSPGPLAMNVYLSSTDFYDMFYPGGAFSLQSALSWAINSGGDKDLPDWPSVDKIVRAAKPLPLVEADRRATGHEISFFRDWALHRTRDSYWETVDGKERIRSLNAPVLLMAGWYDPFLPGQLRDFTAIGQSTNSRVRDNSRIVIGPWCHGNDVVFPEGKQDNFRASTIRDSLDWFDTMTGTSNGKGINAQTTERRTTSPVRIFVAGTNKWRDENEWPLARTRYTSFYLHSAGKANGDADGGELDTQMRSDEPADTYVYDPSNPTPTAGGPVIGKGSGIAVQNKIESRADVLIYTTPPLKADLEVTGNVALQLYVSSTASSTDFAAKLVDVYPDNKSYNVCDGIRRCSFNGLTSPATKTNSNNVNEMKIELWPTSRVFKKGHRLRLEVSSSNFPRFDRNLNTGDNDPLSTRTVTARQTIYHDRVYPSSLILPVIPE